MTNDSPYHFPPDVFDAVVDAIPLLTRSKKDVLLFFRGCGVDADLLATLEARLAADPKMSKYHITREVLANINERGDTTLRQRREVLKRVSEYDDFGSCYPDNQLKAKGSVAVVAQLINKKDSFTRIQQKREDELRLHRDARDAEIAATSALQAEREDLKKDLFALFGETSPHRRGKLLEPVMNKLFACEHLAVREPFVVIGENSEGVIEQIDGAIELDGRLCLTELKWWKNPLGRAEIAPLLVSVFNRADVAGIIISASGFTDAAVAEAKNALSQRTVILVELEEIVRALTLDKRLAWLLRAKVRAANLSKRPLVHPLDEEP